MTTATMHIEYGAREHLRAFTPAPVERIPLWRRLFWFAAAMRFARRLVIWED